MEARRGRDGQWRPSINASPGGILRWVLVGVGCVLLLVLLFSSYYTVKTEEQAVVLRFGRYVGTTEPGLHFKLPFGIDRAIKVPVSKVHKEEFGFRTARAGVRTEYEAAADPDIKFMLTGDLNIATVEWVVQYRIRDAREWLFNVRDQTAAIRDLSECVTRQVVGDHTVTEVVGAKRDSIKSQIQDQLQIAVNAYQLGVQIETVELQNVNPPDAVKASFNEVNSAEQERSRMENEALKERNRVIPRARGKAKQELEQAEGYAIDRVNRAKGDVARFQEMLEAYKESPEVTRQRLYLETIERVLPKVKRIVVADESGVLKLLPLEGAGGGR